MEFMAYFSHRFLFHGPLWFIHKSHHEPTHGVFEVNDIFSGIFGATAMWFMYLGKDAPLEGWLFAIGAGVTLYGIGYFILHDIYTHNRFGSLKSDNWLFKLIRRAHHRHHNDIGKRGQEPYGLFLFPYDKYIPQRWRKKA